MMSDAGLFVLVVLFAFPYFALLRLIWHAGTFFKNHRNRLEYNPSDYE